MEKLDLVTKPVELVRFIGERLLGGGWSELPNTATTEPKPPVRANITYITGE